MLIWAHLPLLGHAGSHTPISFVRLHTSMWRGAAFQPCAGEKGGELDHVFAELMPHTFPVLQGS